jgi:hypothetical protein
VRFLRADAMLRTLKQSRLDNSRDAEMIALTSVDLLIVDSCGAPAYVEQIRLRPFHRRGTTGLAPCHCPRRST